MPVIPTFFKTKDLALAARPTPIQTDIKWKSQKRLKDNYGRLIDLLIQILKPAYFTLLDFADFCDASLVYCFVFDLPTLGVR